MTKRGFYLFVTSGGHVLNRHGNAMDANAGNTVRGMRKKVLTMDEYIEREALLEAFERTEYDISTAYEPDGFSYKLVCEVIDTAPAADVAPVRHGRWLPQVVLGQNAWDCSDCKTLGSPHWKW